MNSIRNVALGAIISSLSAACVADFESDTTPVDMRDFWPESSYLEQTYRNPYGVMRYKRITKADDPMEWWLPPPLTGEVRFGREDWLPLTYGSETVYFNNMWGMSKRADKSVWEQTDSWPASSTCTNWCNGPGQTYSSNGIVHGRPGGHTLGESYYSNYGVTNYYTPNLQTTAPSTGGATIHSVVRMIDKYNNFTPWYGRETGIWGAGNAKTYSDVILMEFSHGTSPDKSCGNLPSGYVHQTGYTTFWQYIWYAKNVGEIQRMTLFDERSCNGYEIDGIAWSDYIDEDH
jgi:hypothetical protein